MKKKKSLFAPNSVFPKVMLYLVRKICILSLGYTIYIIFIIIILIITYFVLKIRGEAINLDGLKFIKPLSVRKFLVQVFFPFVKNTLIFYISTFCLINLPYHLDYPFSSNNNTISIFEDRSKGKTSIHNIVNPEDNVQSEPNKVEDNVQSEPIKVDSNEDPVILDRTSALDNIKKNLEQLENITRRCESSTINSSKKELAKIYRDRFWDVADNIGDDFKKVNDMEDIYTENLFVEANVKNLKGKSKDYENRFLDIQARFYKNVPCESSSEEDSD